MDVASLAGNLAATPWDWTPDGNDAVLRSAGWSPAEEKGTRRSYERDGYRLSAYREGDRVVRLEVTVAAALPDPDDEWQDDLIDEYYARWEQVTGEVAEVLGKPRYSDGRGNRGYPADQTAEWASVWPRDGFRVMVTQTHEDKELPFRINVVCAPGDPRL